MAEIYDGMVLGDSDLDSLPDWVDDDNCSLECIASDGVPTPDFRPRRVWRLHLHGEAKVQHPHPQARFYEDES